MPTNPIFSPATDGQQVGVSPANPINDPIFSSNQGSNTFDLKYQNLLTARYGEITPFFYYTGLGRDRVQLQSSQDLRSYTLSSPLMSQLRMKKGYFSIPLKSIMPNTWDYLFVNPVKGNDVPDDAYCYVDLFKLLYNIAYAGSVASNASLCFKLFMLFYSLVSKGSLFDYLGISTSALVKNVTFVSSASPTWPTTLDEWFDAFVAQLVGINFSFILDYVVTDPSTGESDSVIVKCDSSSSHSDWVSLFNTFLQHPDATVTIADTFNVLARLSSVLECFVSYYKNLNSDISNPTYKFEVNLYKVIAYHLAVAQYYTNDHVDNIYNANLWMSNMKSLVYSMVSGQSELQRYFSLNGIDVYYDVFSNHFLDKFSFNVSDAWFANELYFWFNLSTYARSLKYGDYFCSSRPLPLAVGDVNVPVLGSNVSVIDINKNLHIQRFLNAVNRIGSNIVDYAKGIFGYRPQAVEPAPNFIATEYVNVGADEIDNTSGTDTQGTVNTNLVAQSSHFAFDVNLTDPCIILGLLSFECVGAYPYATERDNFHKDRYDMFNPFLQHIGDQEVKYSELGNSIGDNALGYQVRYAEYKFKYNQQHGGFNGVLKSWSLPIEINSPVIDEDFIRANPADFDRFYKSLANASLANYFHFQISFQNSLIANRAMDYQPNLLG